MVLRYLRRVTREPFIRVLVLLALASFFGCFKHPESGKLRKIELPSSGSMTFGVIESDCEDLDRLCPIILAVPLGNHEIGDVVRSLDLLWGDVATTRGWMVVCPATGPGLPYSFKVEGLFGQGPEQRMPEFLQALEQTYPMVSGGLHVVQVGWNGAGAMAIAMSLPQATRSVTILPELQPNYSLLERFLAADVAPITILYSNKQVERIRRDLVERQLHNQVQLVGIDAGLYYQEGERVFVQSMPYVCEAVMRSVNQPHE